MTTDTVGGVWTYTIDLCRFLQPHHVEVLLFTSGAPLSPAQWKTVEQLAHVTVEETTYKLEWMENPWDDIRASGRKLLGLEQRFQPDVIHLNSYSYGTVPFRAPVLITAHSDVFSWWDAVHHSMPPSGWNEYFRSVQHGLNGAALITAPSAAMMECIRDIYAIWKPFRVIYNARDERQFDAGKQKEKYVFSAGRIWDKGKNIISLVKAAYTVNAAVYIAGDHPEDYVVHTAPSNLHFTGKLEAEELKQKFSEAAIYALPALYEPFGLSALEAALSGCALVLGDIPSLREIWQENALYVPPGDHLKLAETINRLLGDNALLERYAGKALAHARTFSGTSMAHSYMNCYRYLLEHARQHSSDKILSI